ncbi:FkbM family methyltransferase [Candidatus Parvarchaeota archaeon]|nr:FkbM family methyltransferase [Candidatus Acidifodinimicrobium mancum]
MEKAPILDRIKGKSRTYRLIYRYHLYPISKLVFYDTFGRIFYKQRPATIIALKEFGLKFSSNSQVWEVFLQRIYTSYRDFIPTKNDIVVDVGAQYGDYAVLCAGYYKVNKVYCFEPLKSNFKEIEKNIKLNKLKNISAYNVALGSENKMIKITYGGDMAGIVGDRTQKTYLKMLDSYRLKPTILKIDVEGFEMDVLRGAIKTIGKYHPKIIIETHTLKLRKEVLSFLGSMRYKVKHYGRSATSKTGEFDFVQNLFLR